ncbi:hypothetical protein Ddc_16043 [Ditylenchus destructor]|nr:hypothetical protein Ddc_16043 [Ditylenchus destructor]
MNRYIVCTLPVFLLLAYIINCCVSPKSRLPHKDQNGGTEPMNEFESGPLMNEKTRKLEIATAENSLTNRVKIMQSPSEQGPEFLSITEGNPLHVKSVREKVKESNIAAAGNSMTNRAINMQRFDDIHDPVKSLLEHKYPNPEVQGIIESESFRGKTAKEKLIEATEENSLMKRVADIQKDGGKV